MLSVIVTVDGTSEYPQQCLESLLNQSYESKQILVVPYGQLPKWELPEDCGLQMSELACDRVDALNQGIRIAEGEYILFLDPDTWLDEDALEIFADEAEAEELDVLRFNCIREYRNRGMVPQNPILPDRVCRGEDVMKACRLTVGLTDRQMVHTEWINGLAMANFCLYRKAVIDENGLQFEAVADKKLFSDCLFNARFLAKAQSFQYMKVALCHCMTPEAYGLNTEYQEDFLARQQQFFQKLREFVDCQEDPRFLEAYYNRVACSTLEIGLNVLKSNKSKKEMYWEFKALRKSAVHRNAYKMLSLRCLPAAWKMYYFYAKYGFTRRLYSMTKTIRAYQQAGR